MVDRGDDVRVHHPDDCRCGHTLAQHSPTDDRTPPIMACDVCDCDDFRDRPEVTGKADSTHGRGPVIHRETFLGVVKKRPDGLCIDAFDVLGPFADDLSPEAVFDALASDSRGTEHLAWTRGLCSFLNGQVAIYMKAGRQEEADKLREYVEKLANLRTEREARDDG